GLSLDAETARRPAARARRRLRPVSDAAALSVVRVGGRGLSPRQGSGASNLRRVARGCRRRRRDRAVGRRQVASRGLSIHGARARGLERRDVARYNKPAGSGPRPPRATAILRRMSLPLSSIQRTLAIEQIDGWLLYDFHGSNPIALKLTGLAGGG